ncbi:MAG TPA: hypothetical protein VIL20_27130 [Sandaracinaceae bacterium]
MRALLFVAIALGCGSPGPDGAGPNDASADDAAAREPRVELGTGRFRFVPIDGELELVAGPQGGWHVDVGARMWNLRADGLRIAYEASRGGVPIHVPTEIELDTRHLQRAGDHWLRRGDVLQLAIASPDEVTGVELELRVRVWDRAGAAAEDARTAIVVDRE